MSFDCIQTANFYFALLKKQSLSANGMDKTKNTHGLKQFKNFFSAPLINAAVDRYNRIDDRIHHQELISEVANRISMLEREKEYLTRQLNSSLLSRPTLWV